MTLAAADFSQIPMSQNLAATLARASDMAGAMAAGEVALEHVLLALCDDPDAEAVLTASRVNVNNLKGETLGYLNSLQRAPNSGVLAVSQALSRILEAAAAAARGSRRRDINGAIVLAAIVGEGRSAAAQILQVHGLTFDEAIRALQAALAPPTRDAVPEIRPADDVLARARERVQSRAAPGLRDIVRDRAPPIAADAPVPELPPQLRDDATGQVVGAGLTAAHEPSVPQAPPFHEAGHEPGYATSHATSHEPRFDSIARPVEPEVRPDAPIVMPDVAATQPPPDAPGDGAALRVEPRFEAEPPTMVRPSAPPNFQPMGGPVAAPRDDFGSAEPWPMAAPRAEPVPAPYPIDFARPAPIAVPPPIPMAPMSPPMAAPAPPFRGGMPGGFGAPPPTYPPAYPPSPSMPNGMQGEPFGMPAGMPAPMPGQPPRMGPPNGPMNSPYGNTGSAAAPLPKDMHMPPPTAGGAAQPKSKRSQRAKIETGQLSENIPRAMRVGKTVSVEVRIGKATAKAITQGLEGGGVAWRHELTVTQAMSVRLRAPDGGFFIETASPETQWIENNLGLGSDDFASWRFHITPQARGWSRVQIIVSARTIGADGMAAETALPDQLVDVKVRTNYGHLFARWTGWVLAAVVGGVLAKFGEGVFALVLPLVEKLTK